MFAAGNPDKCRSGRLTHKRDYLQTESVDWIKCGKIQESRPGVVLRMGTTVVCRLYPSTGRSTLCLYSVPRYCVAVQHYSGAIVRVAAHEKTKCKRHDHVLFELYCFCTVMHCISCCSHPAATSILPATHTAAPPPGTLRLVPLADVHRHHLL